MSTEIIETSALYQRAIREGREDGLREGLRVVLTGRFGTLPAEVEQAIAAASVAALDDTLLHAGAESLEQLQTRLGVAQP